MIGERLSPVLSEIENTLLEFYGIPPEFTDEGFRAAIYIFESALIDKMFQLQKSEAMSLEDACNMATSAGNAIRELVKVYTNINTHDLFK